MNQVSPLISQLPIHVLQAVYFADEHERKLRNWTELHPKRGPIALPSDRKPDPALIAESEEELEDLVKAFKAAIGQKGRGNKRLGRKLLYAALVQNFYHLKKMGVRLPANKCLSRSATQHGLARTLVMFELVKEDESLIMSHTAKGMALRRRIAASYDRVFTRVAGAVDGKLTLKNPPAKIKS